MNIFAARIAIIAFDALACNTTPGSFRVQHVTISPKSDRGRPELREYRLKAGIVALVAEAGAEEPLRCFADRDGIAQSQLFPANRFAGDAVARNLMAEQDRIASGRNVA